MGYRSLAEDFAGGSIEFSRLFYGIGLAFGRMGDALGTWVTQALTASPARLVVTAFSLFVAANALLYRLVTRLLAVTAPAQGSDAPSDAFDPLVEFSSNYGLSRREKDVLYFLLDGRTNAEAAKELSVTEATVKFHVSNILKKTGCTSRNDVAKLYNQSLRGW